MRRAWHRSGSKRPRVGDSTPRPVVPERVDELKVDRPRELFAELDAEPAGRVDG